MTNEGNGNNSRELEMGLSQMEQIKAQVESLRSQTASLQSILMDYTNSMEVIGSLMEESEEEVLMPIGGSAFLKVKLIDKEKCLMDRGAGIFVDTPLEDAKLLVNERIMAIRNGISRIDKTAQELMERYEEVSNHAQEIYNRQMMAGAGPEKTF